MQNPNINDESYTNRELFILFDSAQQADIEAHKNILEGMETFHNSVGKKLDELVVQTKKTNGNVMDLLLWRAFVKGQTWIIPIVVSAIISAVVGIMFINFK